MGVCGPFRQNLRRYLAQDFINRFKYSSPDTFFLSIGKVTPWNDPTTGVTNDSVPNDNVDCPQEDTDFWRSCIAHKRLTPDDVSLVLKRFDWEVGKAYDAFRDDVDLYDDTNASQFYVLVDEVRVYKCIDNNYGAVSTEPPTHTDSQIRTLSDGYRWKFMYQIPESKRKFLTKNYSGGQGYMPVEFVESLRDNDDRELQWGVQQDAVPGSIDFIEINSAYANKVVSDRVIFYDAANIVVSATGAGSSSILLGGSSLVPQNNYYNGRVLRIEAGQGEGQQREITSYTYNSNGTALVNLKYPLNFGVTSGTGADASLYSILPNVQVVGDGSSNNNTFNTYYDAAELTVKFSSESLSGNQKYVESIEVANVGSDYTFATVSIGAGLTAYNGATVNFSEYATPILGYPGGNGFNPVDELGCSGLLIVTTFDQSENDTVTTNNDYRQFALLKNLELTDPVYKISYNEAGISGSYAVGDTVYQISTGAQGEVTSWASGISGVTATSRLVVKRTSTSGDFSVGATGLDYHNYTIHDVHKETLAGREGNRLIQLKLVPIGATGTVFDPTGFDYTRQHLCIGIGNTADNVTPSNATGIIHSWELDLGSNLVGSLYLEYAQGTFTLGEYVIQGLKDRAGFETPKGKIIDILEVESDTQTIYDQITHLYVASDGVHDFSTTSFTLDSQVIGLSGSTEVANGYIVDWIPQSVSKGDLYLNNVFGTFAPSNTISYSDGVNTYTGEVSDIIASPDVKYRVGDVLHVQNIRPVERSIEQQEEIKFLVEF